MGNATDVRKAGGESRTILEAASRRGIDVQALAVDAHAEAAAEVVRLRSIIRDAIQHLEHERPAHALRVLDRMDAES